MNSHDVEILLSDPSPFQPWMKQLIGTLKAKTGCPMCFVQVCHIFCSRQNCLGLQICLKAQNDYAWSHPDTSCFVMFCPLFSGSQICMHIQVTSSMGICTHDLPPAKPFCRVNLFDKALPLITIPWYQEIHQAPQRLWRHLILLVAFTDPNDKDFFLQKQPLALVRFTNNSTSLIFSLSTVPDTRHD